MADVIPFKSKRRSAESEIPADIREAAVSVAAFLSVWESDQTVRRHIRTPAESAFARHIQLFHSPHGQHTDADLGRAYKAGAMHARRQRRALKGMVSWDSLGARARRRLATWAKRQLTKRIAHKWEWAVNLTAAALSLLIVGGMAAGLAHALHSAAAAY